MNGTHIWTQISHPGRQCSRLVSLKPHSPSDVQLKILSNFAPPKAMTESEIQTAIQHYVDTAELSIEAGFTGVQIHAAHGYLISQFLSPVTNKRTDTWGGSLENRAKFLLETVRQVRKAVGKETPVSVKLNSADFQKGGFTLEESAQVAVWLAEQGIDLLEISGGTYEQLSLFGRKGDDSTLEKPKSEQRESTRLREAYFLEYASIIQKALEESNHKVPLLVTGGFRSRTSMNTAIQDSNVDMIGLARPLLIDPDCANKLLDGSIDDIVIRSLDMGKGIWATSKYNDVRALNAQAEVSWYYRQMLRMAEGNSPDMSMSPLRALVSHLIREYKIGIGRRLMM
ncbi:oxidoreductase [Veronia nyctiphanis]|uniref:oxidoreductase n=1 Tax=Veronia nyctiphanis TaxID=1278244 RepID=UPI00191BE7DA|nr:NADH oxidase [Veronia nyctiphanis]